METRSRRVQWMAMVIMVLHLLAIIIFTRGFLLTRTELPFQSNCSDVSQSPCLSPSDFGVNRSSYQKEQSCWTKPSVDRVVIIILDALRFDFLAPSSFFPEPKPWMDRLRVLQKLASTNGSSAKIFKAFADPPTTSLQRLKGLTTGGLPTFIDVGNSFGAPAIIEDNLIKQLVHNGKRVVMMGDDTWVQLFPHHFTNSYPYPSFNVKDLHTVDNGCVENLLPSLYEDEWDVLIAHFLGVDHAGHIFGVDSIPMIEKLEQYNNILEQVIHVMESQSGTGGLHENTLLVVMGDHGQTLNGDHGGGTPEEVETSLFAMNFRKPPPTFPSEFDTAICELDLVQDGEKICISSIQQLDFAVTLSAILGIPFPFGSIGRVNLELYALGAGSWNSKGISTDNSDNHSMLIDWMENYLNVLCINAWQVKRYIDVYSASSVIGFSSDQLSKILGLYSQAEENWTNFTKNEVVDKNKSGHSEIPAFRKQIDAYVHFLSSFVELARLNWTEFNLNLMATGFGIMLISLYIHFLAIIPSKKSYCVFPPGISCEAIFTSMLVMVRACSFLSNSYILEEGKVANFLLATIGLIKLRFSVIKKEMPVEVIVFLILILGLRISIEVGLSKQAATSQFMNSSHSWVLGIPSGDAIWIYVAEIMPILSLIILACVLYKVAARYSSEGMWNYVIVGSILAYFLIAVHWISESNIFGLNIISQGIGRKDIPQSVFAIGCGQLLLLVFANVYNKRKASDCRRSLLVKTVAIVSACSSTIIILSGKQGPMVALVCLVGGYCIMRLEGIEWSQIGRKAENSTLNPLSVTQWSLLAVCLFFATGHWCAFDGLRYGAAFIGFDEFVLVRQAILLAIETFGFSHVLPVFGLPLLAAYGDSLDRTKGENFLFKRLFQMYMLYGLIMATTVTATILCVTIQRRHLMVWGLFAPKFVFDVVGLILTDVLICVASFYYF